MNKFDIAVAFPIAITEKIRNHPFRNSRSATGISSHIMTQELICLGDGISEISSLILQNTLCLIFQCLFYSLFCLLWTEYFGNIWSCFIPFPLLHAQPLIEICSYLVNTIGYTQKHYDRLELVCP